MASLQFTIDELGRLSESEAWRRDSDHGMRRTLRWMLRAFLGISFLEVIATSQHGASYPAGVVIAVVNLLVVLPLVLSFRVWDDPNGFSSHLPGITPLSRFVQRQIRAVALVYIVLQLWIVLSLTPGLESWSPWLTLFPFFPVLFRFTPAERFAVHTIFILTGVAAWLFSPAAGVKGFDFGLVIAVASTNLIALGIGLLRSSRRRKSFVREFTRIRDEAADRIRMRQELEYARQIQLSMLPREIPRIDWIDLASVSLPATEVGGDYYDFYFPSPDGIVLTCADVAGHGLGSGLVLSGVRSGLALLSDQLDHPEVVMERMHGMIRRTTAKRMLVTMALLAIDRRSRVARYATAGHPPLLLRRSSGSVEEILHGSLPLGAGLGDGFPVHEIAWNPGDLFLLHTDGLYETRNPEGQSYGLERLMDVMAALPTAGSAAEARDSILRDVTTFRESGQQEDDLTIVVAKMA
ncbi:MAG: PP2C family protein-serine/threonine phosphatase [Thermoanaerobaculia bacterium]